MRAWWDARTASERRVLWAGALVLVAAAWYLVLIEPLNEERARTLARVHAAKLLHADLLALRAEARQLALRGNTYTSFEVGASLISVVNRTAADSGTQAFTRRINPIGSDAIAIFLDDVPFAQLRAWLVALETQHGVTVDRVALERSQPGLVDAQLTLKARALE